MRCRPPVPPVCCLVSSTCSVVLIFTNEPSIAMIVCLYLSGQELSSNLCLGQDCVVAFINLLKVCRIIFVWASSLGLMCYFLV